MSAYCHTSHISMSQEGLCLLHCLLGWKLSVCLDIHRWPSYIGIIAVTQHSKLSNPGYLEFIEVTVNCNFAPLLYKPILLYLLGTAIHLLRYPQIPSFHRLNRCQWHVVRTSRCHRPCGSTPCWYILYPRLYFLGFKALLSLVSIQLSNWLLVSLTFCLSPSKSSMIFP